MRTAAVLSILSPPARGSLSRDADDRVRQIRGCRSLPRSSHQTRQPSVCISCRQSTLTGTGSQRLCWTPHQQSDLTCTHARRLKLQLYACCRSTCADSFCPTHRNICHHPCHHKVRPLEERQAEAASRDEKRLTVTLSKVLMMLLVYQAQLLEMLVKLVTSQHIEPLPAVGGNTDTDARLTGQPT